MAKRKPINKQKIQMQARGVDYEEYNPGDNYESAYEKFIKAKFELGQDNASYKQPIKQTNAKDKNSLKSEMLHQTHDVNKLDSKSRKALETLYAAKNGEEDSPTHTGKHYINEDSILAPFQKRNLQKRGIQYETYSESALEDQFKKDNNVSDKGLALYMQYLKEAKNKDINARWEEQARQTAKDTPAYISPYNVIDWGSDLPAGILAAAESVRHKFDADPNSPVDTNSGLYRLQNFNAAYKQQQVEDIKNYFGKNEKAGAVASMGYEGIMAAGEQIPSFLLGAGAGTAAKGLGASANGIKMAQRAAGLPGFGASAYASTLKSAQERGLPQDQAVATAAIAGLTEMATEVFSLDYALDIAKKSGKAAARNKVVNWLLEAGIEGTEEGTGDVINEIADRIINTDQSEYSMRVQNYMSNGESEKDAKKKATWDFVMSTLQDMAVGTISGGLMGGIATGAQDRSYSAVARNVEDGDYLKVVENLPTEESSYENKTGIAAANDAVNLAQSLAKKAEDGTEITQKEKKKLVSLVDEARQNMSVRSEKAEAPAEEKRSKAQIMADMSQAKNARELTKAYHEAVENIPAENRQDTDTLFNIKAGQLNLTTAQVNSARMSDADVYNAGYENKRIDHLTPQQQVTYREGAMKRFEEEARATAEVTGKASNDAGKEFTVKEINGLDSNDMTLLTDDGEVKLSQVKFANKGEQTLYNQAAQMGNVAAAKAYVDNYVPGMPVRAYDDVAQKFYTAGQLGTSFDSMRIGPFEKQVGTEGLRALYDAGREVDKAESKQTKKTTTAKKGEGRLIDSRENKGETLHRGFLGQVAEKFGIDIEITDSLAADKNGTFEPAMGRLVLNTNNPDMYKTLFHELSEFGQAYNAEGMDDLRVAMMEYVMDKAPDSLRQSLIAYQNAYKQVEGSKSISEASEELFNDLLSEIFRDEAGIQDFVNWVVDTKTETEAQGLIQRLAELIQKICDSISKYVSGNRELTNVQKTAAEMDVQRAKEMRSKLLQAFDMAIKNRDTMTENKAPLRMSYEAQIDAIEDGTFNPNSYLVVRSDLPELFVDFAGMSDAPVVMNYRKAKISMEESGPYSDHYHNLGPDIMKKIPEAMEHPKMILDHKGRINAILEITDKKGRDILISLQMDKGKYVDKQYANLKGDSQAVLITAFGAKENYINKLVSESKVLYDNKKAPIVHQGSQRAKPSDTSALSNSILTPANENATTTSSRNSLVVDTEGRKLAPRVKEYFKNSKLVDEQGRLKEMYHGTRYAGFTVFQLAQMDDGASIFLSDNPIVSKSYAGTKDFYEPDRPWSFNELETVMSFATGGDWQVEKTDSGVRIIELGFIGEEDTVHDFASVAAAQEYFINEFFNEMDLKSGESAAVYRLYGNATNPLVIDAKGNNWNELDPVVPYATHFYDVEVEESKHDITITYHDEDGNVVTDSVKNYNNSSEMYKKYGITIDEETDLFENDYIYIDDIFLDKDGKRVSEYGNTREWAKYARENGYDSVIFNNVIDSGLFGANEERFTPSTVAVVFNPNQVKSIYNQNPTENEDIRYSIDVQPERVFYTKAGTEVVQNPTSKEYSQMREDILQDRPWMRGTGEPLFRHTYDEQGNEYYWDAMGGLHAQVEPEINKKYNTRTSQQWNWWTREDKDDYPVDYSTRFSLDVPVEESKNLIAVHNIHSTEMMDTLKLGGFPMPSIAITKPEMGHDMYGNVSVLFYKDTIDPKFMRANKVYSGDAYTPTFPQIGYKVDSDKIAEIRDHLKSVMGDKYETFGYMGLDSDNVTDYLERNRGNVVDAYENKQGYKYAFTKDKGYNVDVPMKESNVSPYYENGLIQYVSLMFTPEQALKYFQESREAYEDFAKDGTLDKILQKVNAWEKKQYSDKKLKSGKSAYDMLHTKELEYRDFDQLMNGINKYYREGIKEEVDRVALSSAINEVINEHRAEYEQWLRDLFDGVILEQGIRNQKDMFTPSGNRRNWNSIYDPYNLTNLVKAMKAEPEQGQSFGGYSIFGSANREFSSIEDIHSEEGRLQQVDQDAYSKMKDEIEDDLRAIAAHLKPSESYDTYSIMSDIAEAAATRKTKSGMKSWLSQWYDVTDSDMNDIMDIVKRAAELPTGYFEAKPRRAVGFDEIARVVVPDLETDLQQALSDKNIPYVTYKAGDKESRKAAVNSVAEEKPDVRFSINLDTQGRELSAEQQEFFANSKVRDNEGRLKVMYHGTPNYGFTVFDRKKAKGSGYYGRGFYFSDVASNAGVYGQQYEVYLNVTNPVQPGTNEITKEQLRAFLEAVAEDEDYGLDNYGYGATVDSVLNSVWGKDDFGMLADINAACIGDYAAAVKLFNETNGTDYDGIIAPTETVVFESNQIKNVDNLNPTGSEDIRYSLNIDNDFGMWDTEDLQGTFIDEDGQELDLGNSVINAEETISGLARYLQAANEPLKGHKVNASALQQIAEDLVKKYNSTADVNVVADNLKIVFDYLQKTDDINYNEITKLLSEVSRPIIEQSGDVNEEMVELYEAFKGYIKGQKIALTDGQKKAFDLTPYGSFNNYRKANFGTLNFVNDGASLDSLWNEMCEKAKGFLDVDTNEEDMGIALADALTAMKPQAESLYGYDAREASIDLAGQIMEAYYKAEQEAIAQDVIESGMASPTAKYMIESARKDMKKEIMDYRKKTKELYNKQLEDMQGKISEIMAANNALAYDVRNLEKKNEQLTKKMAEQVVKAKARNKTTELKRYVEAEEIKKQKEEINKIAIDLLNRATNPTNKKYMQEGLRKPIAEFLTGIDFVSHRARLDSKNTVKWTDRMQALRKYLSNAAKGDEPEAIGIVLDPDLIEDMDRFATRNSEVTKVSKLPSWDLKELHSILSRLRTAVNKSNEMFTNELYKNQVDFNQAAYRELKEQNSQKNINKLMNGIRDFLNKDLEDPVTYFELLGETHKTLFDSLLKGFDKRAEHIREYVEFMKKLQQGKEQFYKWENKKHTFQLEEGTLEITEAQIMSLYETMKREQAKGHILPSGFKVSKVTVGGKEIIQNKPVRIKPAEYLEIINTLSAEQKEVADAIQKFMAVNCAKWGNNTSMKLFGYKKFNEKNYFPIKTDATSRDTNQQDVSKQAGLWANKNMSASKELTIGANNAIVIGDIFDVFADHVTDMATYDGMVLPQMDAMRWFNYRAIFKGENETGEIKDTYSIKEQLQRLMGTAGTKYFENLMLGINGMEPKARSASAMTKFIGNYKKAAVTAKIRVAIQQPTAIIRALDEMNGKYISKALATTNFAKYSKIAQEKSNLAWWKAQGYYEAYLGKSIKDMAVGKNPALQAIDDYAGFGAQKADDLTWGALYHAVEYEIADTTDLKPGTEAFDAAVVTRFEEVVTKTQVVDTMIHRTDIMRNQNDFVKLATSFMAEPLKTYNMCLRSIAKYARAPRDKKMWRKLMRTLIVYTLNNAILTAVTSSWDAVRDDDDKTPYSQRWIDRYSKEFIDNMNPVNMLPYVKDVVELFESRIKGEYYSSTDMATAGFDKAATFLVHLGKVLSGEKINKTPYGLTLEGLQAIQTLSGMPIYNVVNDINTVHNGLTDNWETKQSTSDYGDLHKAITKDKDVKEEVQDLLEMGKDKSGIKSSITGKFKEEYQEATGEDKQQIRESVTEALVEAGYTQEEAQNTLDKWDGVEVTEPQFEEYHSDYESVYDAIDKGGDVQGEVQKMLDSGKQPRYVKSSITNRYKDQLVKTRDANLRNALVRAYMAAGDTNEEANKKIESWFE